jgi:cystathionine beta-lyase
MADTRDPTTLCVHAPEPPGGFAALTAPVHRASTVVFPDAEGFEARGGQLYDGYSYGLYGTPTTRGLEDHLAALEGASRAIVLPSGLAAIAAATLACTAAGDRVLLPASLYGPARGMAGGLLARFGVEVVTYDPKLDAGIAALLDARTRLVWVESPGSATFEVQDVPLIARLCHARGALVAADNTWATPLGFAPLAHGVDISMGSLSKYAGGHSDLLMGSLAVTDMALFRRLKDTVRMLGYGVSGEDCFLVSRGLATLPMRLARSAETAARLMDHLAGRTAVVRLLHPSRPGHPGHDSFVRDFRGGAGLFGLVLRADVAPRLGRALGALRLFRLGASWGGAHSLIAPSDPRRGRDDLGWLPAGPYLRIAVGLEAFEDLAADLDRLFDALKAQRSDAERAAAAHAEGRPVNA